MGSLKNVLLMGCLVLMICFEPSEAEIPKHVLKMIRKVNKGGPYTGLVVPSSSELEQFLESPIFRLDGKHEHIDFAGRRFYIGHIGDRKLILAVTGKGMINAAITTQMLCSMFKISGVLHYGLGSSTDESLTFGDIAIPKYWAHTGVWNWQKYGDELNDGLSFDENEEYTRQYGYLNFADFTNITNDEDEEPPENLLYKVWYQPEEIFLINGTLESKEKVFWIPVSHSFFEFAQKIEGMKLDECINVNTCLPKTPSIVLVERGSSANIHIDNVAYKTFLHSRFESSVADMESAAVALITYEHNIPFIAFRALSDMACNEEGLVPMDSEEARDYLKLLFGNCIKVAISFIKNMKDMVDDDIRTV